MSGNLGEQVVFCTLQNQSKLQGIEPFDEESVLVTLEKVVTIIKVIDQQPLSSWNLKEGFSCAAVYSKVDENFVAVTKSNQIVTWTEESSHLEKAKKNVVKTPILKLCNLKGVVNVVFQNGAILPVDDAIEKKKEDIPGAFDSKASEVFFAKSGLETFSVFISADCSQFWLISKGKVFSEGKLAKDKCKLQGIGFNDSTGSLVTFWSDLKLLSFDVFGSEEFPGKLLGKINCLTKASKVGITAVGPDCISLFGTGASGVKCVLFNSKYKFIQEEKSLKGAEKNPQIIGPLLSHVFVTSGTQVLSIPLSLNQIYLEDMLGKSEMTDDAEVEILDWDSSPPESPQISLPEHLESTHAELLLKGLPETKISEMMLQPLMEKKDIASISFLLNNMNKVSETMLAKLVSYCLRGEDRDFSDEHSDGDEFSASLPPESPLMGARKRLLNLILSKSLTSAKLLPEVRRHLSPQDAVLFIQHAASQLWDGDTPTSCTENLLSQMVVWISVLLDAHYQYCLLTCDQQVTTVLTALLSVIDMQIAHTNELGKLKPLVEHVIRKYECESKSYVSKLTVFPMTDPACFE